MRLSAFWIAKHPVTNAQYAAFLRERPEQPKPEDWDNARFRSGLARVPSLPLRVGWIAPDRLR